MNIACVSSSDRWTGWMPAGTGTLRDGVGWALRPVPLVGGLYGKAVDIAEDVNDFFSYTY